MVNHINRGVIAVSVRRDEDAQLEFQLSVDDYFDKCEAEERFPSEAGLMIHLGLTRRFYELYQKDPLYADILENAMYRRADWLENQMVTNPRSAAGCMNALTQPQNGGYKKAATSKASSGERKLTINMKGVGKSAAK